MIFHLDLASSMPPSFKKRRRTSGSEWRPILQLTQNSLCIQWDRDISSSVEIWWHCHFLTAIYSTGMKLYDKGHSVLTYLYLCFIGVNCKTQKERFYSCTGITVEMLPLNSLRWVSRDPLYINIFLILSVSYSLPYIMSALTYNQHEENTMRAVQFYIKVILLDCGCIHMCY